MKIVPLLVSFLCSIRAVAASSYPCDNHGVDHLLPADWSIPIDNAYRKLLESRLALTPFDYGRAIAEPSLGLESCISVFSRASAGHRTYWVTLTRPTSSLWQATAGVNQLHPKRAANIKTNRIEAQIRESTAELIKQAWVRMLKDIHRRHKTPPPRDNMRVIVGGAIEYSLQCPGDATLYGTLPGLPTCGSSAQALANLSDSLIEYCNAKPSAREAIASRVEREAKRIVSSK
jgi:hypothetical protein